MHLDVDSAAARIVDPSALVLAAPCHGTTVAT